MIYEFHYSKILRTLSVNTTNRLRNSENLKFMELCNIIKCKECRNYLSNFLFRLSALVFIISLKNKKRKLKFKK